MFLFRRLKRQATRRRAKKPHRLRESLQRGRQRELDTLRLALSALGIC